MTSMIGSVFAAMLVLFFSLVPIVIVALIIIAIVRRNNGGSKKPFDFEKVLRTVYVYAVMIIMLFTMVSGTIFLVSSLGEALFPDSRVNSYTMKQLITSIAAVAISAPVFMYHFKQTKVS